MDPFDQLLDLRQGSSSIEEYIIQFCKITYKVPFDEVMLKDIFCFGLNEPIKSCLPAGKFNCSLKDFIDYALLCAGSSLTVGVSEEERNTASETKMADAPEGTHKMATMHHQFTESHNMPAKPQFAHVMPTKPGSAHVMPTEPGSALVVPAKPGSVFVMPTMPESPAKMATTPADAPLGPGLIASVLDPPLVSVRAAGIPRSAALSAPSQELAESAPEAAPSQKLA